MLKLVLFASIVLAVYPVAALLLLKFARAYRMELAEVGKEILQSPLYGEREKQLVSDMLDDAFSWQVPIALAWNFPRYVFDRRETEARNFLQEFLLKERAVRFVTLHAISVFCANPLFAIVLLVEMLFALMVKGSFASVKGTLALTNLDLAPRFGSGVSRP